MGVNEGLQIEVVDWFQLFSIVQSMLGVAGHRLMGNLTS